LTREETASEGPSRPAEEAGEIVGLRTTEGRVSFLGPSSEGGRTVVGESVGSAMEALWPIEFCSRRGELLWLIGRGIAQTYAVAGQRGSLAGCACISTARMGVETLCHNCISLYGVIHGNLSRRVIEG